MDTTFTRRGLCLVISAPSGAGKTTLLHALMQAEPQLVSSVSITTRQPRPGEQDGVHYHFRAAAEFDAMAADGQLLEHAKVFGCSYGTPRAPVEAALSSGLDVVFDIDWQGWRQIKSALPADCVGLFILPPSLDALASRLGQRGTDTPEEVARRMQAAESEMTHWEEFDHVLINEDLDRCVALALCVLRAARSSTRRATGVRRMMTGNGT